LTVIPLLIISWVLYLLWKKTYYKIPGSNIVLVVCFLLMWGIVGWMISRDFNTVAYDVTYTAYEKITTDDEGNEKVLYIGISENTEVPEGAKVLERTITIEEPESFKEGDIIPIIAKDNDETAFGYLGDNRLSLAYQNAQELD